MKLTLDCDENMALRYVTPKKSRHMQIRWRHQCSP